MPMEFYKGRPLDPDEFEAIRMQIEQFDTIDAVDNEMRGIVERNRPHLVAKLPRKDDVDPVPAASACDPLTHGSLRSAALMSSNPPRRRVRLVHRRRQPVRRSGAPRD
jgi:hypothetical protein